MSNGLDRRERLHVALVAPPFVRVPPLAYGGTELVVWELACGLVRRGHRVTLVATGDSHVEGAETHWLFPKALWPPEPMAEWNHAVFAASVLAAGGIDVIHAHTPALVPLAELARVPMVHTIHHGHDPAATRLYRSHPRVRHVCISHRQAELEGQDLPVPPTVIHHGLDPRRHPVGEGALRDALFLGRLDPEKAPHLAVRAAREAGLPLRIAGRPHNGSYFPEVLAPELQGGGVTLVGELGGEEKLRALGSAGILLFTSIWEEPFGLVLVEAMLCGTPVVALRHGAVAELVEDGVTGFVASEPEELASLVGPALTLDRRAVRERAAERFNAELMVDRYVASYREALVVEPGAMLPAF